MCVSKFSKRSTCRANHRSGGSIIDHPCDIHKNVSDTSSIPTKSNTSARTVWVRFRARHVCQQVHLIRVFAVPATLVRQHSVKSLYLTRTLRTKNMHGVKYHHLSPTPEHRDTSLRARKAVSLSSICTSAHSFDFSCIDSTRKRPCPLVRMPILKIFQQLICQSSSSPDRFHL